MSAMDLEIHAHALTSISPMPDDAALEADPERIDRYQSLIAAIGAEAGDHADSKVIQSLAGSFGLGDGFGIYWSTVRLIEKYRGDPPTYDVVRAYALEGSPGVRKWCCLILGRRRALMDLPIFLALLHNGEPAVVVESLQAIRMLAQSQSIPEAVSPTEALLNSAHSDICGSRERRHTGPVRLSDVG